jgi:hypothetical protein
MLRRTRFRAGLLGLSAVAACAALTGASAKADDYAACAKYDNPLAYNACLAQQGPAAHGSRASTPPRAAVGAHGSWSSGAHGSWSAGAHGSWTAGGSGGQALIPQRARKGRMVIELPVNPTPSSASVRRHSR